MAGTAVLRIVVSRDSIKNATATSHGNRRLLEPEGWEAGIGAMTEIDRFMGNEEDAGHSFNLTTSASSSSF